MLGKKPADTPAPYEGYVAYPKWVNVQTADGETVKRVCVESADEHEAVRAEAAKAKQRVSE